MLRIDSTKLWNLILQNPEVQKKLERILKDETKQKEKCQEIVLAQRDKILKMQEQQKALQAQINKTFDEETRLHGDISVLEIQKVFLELRLKKVKRQLQRALTSKQKEKLKKEEQHLEEEISSYTDQQENIREQILDIQKDRDTYRSQDRDMAKDIQKEQDSLTTYEENLLECTNILDTRKKRFYESIFEQANEDFKFLQSLVVQNLENEKQLTTYEAKQKADAILIDHDSISIDPPGKTRKLTKEEREKYENIS